MSGFIPNLRMIRKDHTEALAVALSRYYILAGGTATSSPRLLKYLGLADVLDHPDAIEGFTAYTERRPPEFSRNYPFV